MSKILLLEDDVSLVDGLKYSLGKNGFDVTVVRTVEKALESLSIISEYDLLLLDVTLPDGTGFDVCEKVRRQNRQIRGYNQCAIDFGFGSQAIGEVPACVKKY